MTKECHLEFLGFLENLTPYELSNLEVYCVCFDVSLETGDVKVHLESDIAYFPLFSLFHKALYKTYMDKYETIIDLTIRL
jgi:hypothetical protein